MASFEKAFSVTPVTEPFVRASSATTVEVEIPLALMNNWITIKAENQKFWYRFAIGTAGAASGLTLLETQVSGVSGSGNLMAAHADSAFVLEAGDRENYDLSQIKLQKGEILKLLHKSPATGGFIRLAVTSGPEAN